MNTRLFRKWGLAGAGAAALATLATTPAAAHHSFAMYDTTQSKTLTGMLTRFLPGANHAQILFSLLDENGKVVLDEKGKPVMWGVETGAAAQIAAKGVTVKDFPPGTIITVTLHPLKDGRNFGTIARGTGIVKCGTVMPAGGCTPETGDVFMETLPQ
jgi:Family of unknown function (DUF6152)